MKDEGIPRRTVLDKKRETKRVISIEKIIKRKSISDAEIVDAKEFFVPTKNIVIIEIRRGNRPLQGIRLFVIIAISLSLGESIILHPTTPAALQPKPIHIVNACFPQLLHFAKGLSKLKAIRGK